MKRILLFLSIVLLCVSCRSNSEKAMKFLYDNMALADKVTYDEAFWQANVEKTLEVRDRMNWNVPEREFYHFVLPLRVNNEALDNFRTTYADELCERVQGMSMYDAVLEINHWCHEMATYRPADARTSSPMATINSGWGRCGEESVLGVAALRAAGIPARQVYTPRWGHTDDNHAWIEAWVDGTWYFLGACEPEPKLNMGWFNAPVSRALLLHTKVFGDYHGDEDVIDRTAAYTEINVTSGYVPVRTANVTVVDENGAPVKDASVEYKIYNYAEFYSVATYQTPDNGTVSFHTGLGNLLAWAYKGDKFGVARIDGEKTEVVLNHTFGERFGIDFDMVPPPENPIPTDATEEETKLCKERFDKENAIRDAREKGTGKIAKAFIEENGSSDVAVAICKSMSFKDWNDVTRDVLDDALAHCTGEFNEFRDAPRIELEFLYPYFQELASGPKFEKPAQIIDWVKENIKIDDAANPQHLRIPPVKVWRARICDTPSRDIFFVAMCRAAGFESRIDPVTGKTQYREDGNWIDVNFGGAAPAPAEQGLLKVAYAPVPTIKDPLYYRHFSLSKVENGRVNLLAFSEDADQPVSVLFKEPMAVDEGYYCLTSGSRMADGSVLAHLEFFTVAKDATTEIPLTVRFSAEKISVLGTMDAEPYLPVTGRGYFLMAVLGDKDEPTTHAVRQLTAIAEKLNEWGRVCLIYGKARPDGIDKAVFREDGGEQIRQILCKGCDVEMRALPVVTICDSFGRIVYFSQGYNTSLGEELKRVIDQL